MKISVSGIASLLAACLVILACKGEVAAAPATTSPGAASISAVDLTREFLADKHAAAKKYAGKILEITGKVSDPAGGSVQAARVSLEGVIDPKNDLAKRKVNCYMNAKHLKRASELTRGQELTIQGTCGELDFMGGLTVTECAIIKTGPDPAIVISAADLAQAFVTGEDAATEKYVDKQVKVRGKVKSLIEADYAVILEGTAGDKPINLKVAVGYEGWKIAKNLKPGQTITAKGTVSFIQSDNLITLTNSTRIFE